MDEQVLIKPRSKFIKVRCECGNEQVIFSHVATKVLCIVCEKPIAYPKGGKAKIVAEIIAKYN